MTYSALISVSVIGLTNKLSVLDTATVAAAVVVVMITGYCDRCLQKTFVADMKDAVLYSEKFINSKFCPSLSNWGGKAIDGFIAITASGLVRCLFHFPVICKKLATGKF